MIVSFVVMILALLMFTTIGGRIETLVTLGFLSFFFVYLLRLLNVINKPFKVGEQRSNDDVSLFLLYEFAVHARHADADLDGERVVEIVERLEDQEVAGDLSGANAEPATGADGGGLADLDEAVDAAVASVQGESAGREA
jgi:hypothetical protein